MRDAKSPFAEHISGFLAAKRLADRSRVDYARYLREFDAFTGHVSLEEALMLDNAARWIAAVGERGPFAARNAAHYLKSLATWAKKSRYLMLPGGISVLAGLEAPAVPPSTREAFSDEQLEAIWAVLDERPNRDRARAKAYCWLLVATGLRRNEARQLAMADLHIDHEKHRSWILVRWQTSKGSKQRKVRLDREAIGPIDEYVNHSRPTYVGNKNVPEPILLTETGAPFTENGFGSWAGRIFDIFSGRRVGHDRQVGRGLRVGRGRDVQLLARRDLSRGARMRSVRVPKHGTASEYRNHACRCGPCRVAAVADARNHRRRVSRRPTTLRCVRCADPIAVRPLGRLPQFCRPCFNRRMGVGHPRDYCEVFWGGASRLILKLLEAA